jgi:hypothetical protein
MESNHHSARHRVYSAGSSPVLSVRKKEGRTSGFEPEPRGSRPRMLPLHHDHHVSGDDRTRTGACSPDKRVLLPLSYVPLHSAGGIRTHDLELMRLARTASPLRRESARLESNQRSPAPKAGGVAKLPYRQKPIDTADAGLLGRLPELNRSRCRSKSSWLGASRAGLRSVNTPGGIRTRSFRIESPASFRFDHRGVRIPR